MVARTGIVLLVVACSVLLWSTRQVEAQEQLINLPSSIPLDGNVAARIWISGNMCSATKWYALYGGRSGYCYGVTLGDLGVEGSYAGIAVSLKMTCTSDGDACSTWNGKVWVLYADCPAATAPVIDINGNAAQCYQPDLGTWNSLIAGAGVTVSLQVSCGNFSTCQPPTPAPTPAPTPQPTAKATIITMTLARTFPTDVTAFVNTLLSELATALGIPTSRLQVEVSSGSVVVKVKILPPADPATEPSVETVAINLETQVNTTGSTLNQQPEFSQANVTSIASTQSNTTLYYCGSGLWVDQTGTCPSSNNSEGSSSPMLIIIIAVVAVVLLGGALAFYFLRVRRGGKSSTTREYPSYPVSSDVDMQHSSSGQQQVGEPGAI